MFFPTYLFLQNKSIFDEYHLTKDFEILYPAR